MSLRPPTESSAADAGSGTRFSSTTITWSGTARLSDVTCAYVLSGLIEALGSKMRAVELAVLQRQGR
jgi:hypothetical protein